MDTLHAPDDMPLSDTVFERTDRGRLVALKRDHGLSGEAQRLLLMMTGYTPLADLLALLEEDVSPQSMADMVEELLHHQLIQPVYALSCDGSRVHWFGAHGVPARPA